MDSESIRLIPFRIRLFFQLHRLGISWGVAWWDARGAIPGCAADDWRKAMK